MDLSTPSSGDNNRAHLLAMPVAGSTKPEHCKREIYNIMYYCWNKNPEDRPSFSALVQDFESLLGKESDYIDLNMFPEHAYYNELSLSGEKV